jgi:alkyl hydroperoxide reductase subunit AhpC
MIADKSIKVIEIIAKELGMPHESSLSEILAALFVLDKDGEIMKLLVEAGKQDLIDGFREEGMIE